MSEDAPLYSPFVETVGAELVEWTRGRVRWALTVGPQHTNPGGVMHGGVVATMLDEAVANAVTFLRGREPPRPPPRRRREVSARAVARARPGGRREVEGGVLRLGGQVAFAEAEPRRLPGGDLVAKGRFTFLIPDRRRD